jgi:hypothetical protein
MPDVGDVEPERKDVGSSAWAAAEAYGFDMSLIEANLRRTPAERIRMHARTLALALALRQQMKTRRAGP